MGDDITKQSWWRDLTYITQQQLKELIKRKETHQNTQKVCLIVGLFTTIILLIVFGTQLRGLTRDYLFGVFLIVAVLIIYGIVEYSKPAKKKYEKHRETMMNVITEQICVHDEDSNCKCNDTVAKYLKENKKINIMY